MFVLSRTVERIHSWEIQMLIKSSRNRWWILKSWPDRKTTYTSGTIQNEILQLMSLRNTCHRINWSDKLMNKNDDIMKSQKRTFGVIIDGTQDCKGKEEESIRILYVESFDVTEEFLGLYEMLSTSGSSICKMLKDVLTRFQTSEHKLTTELVTFWVNKVVARSKEDPTTGFLHSLWCTCNTYGCI